MSNDPIAFPHPGPDEPEEMKLPLVDEEEEDLDQLVEEAGIPVPLQFEQEQEEGVPEMETVEVDNLNDVVTDENGEANITFAPADDAARTRISDMIVRMDASMRIGAHEQGLSIEEVYAERVTRVETNESLNESARTMALTCLANAFESAKMHPPIDPNDAHQIGALNLLAKGIVKGSTVESDVEQLRMQRRLARRGKKSNSATAKARRKKKKLIKKSKRANR